MFALCATDATGGGSGPTTPPGTGTPDSLAPVVSGYVLSRKVFAVGPKKTPKLATATITGPKQGTTFRYTLSEAAKVKV